MELPSHLLSCITGGSVRIKYNDVPALSLAVVDGRIVIDIQDVPARKSPDGSSGPGLLKKLSGAKSLARELKQDDMTVEIQHHGKAVLRLGAGAKPKLSRVLTGSSEIEICDIKTLRRLGDTV